MPELNEPAISQAELYAAIARAEDMEDTVNSLNKDLSDAQKKIRELEKETESLQDEIVDYDNTISLPSGGSIHYTFEKASLQDTQIMEALQSAYSRIGATKLLSVLEGL
jgi:predicted  nucleic acid-binding Zn-ribbon protein